MVPLVTPTNSPRIGPRSEAYVSISAAVANGFISFAPASLSVSVDEAGDFASTISLTLSRSGAYGTASVSWTVTSITTDDNDLGTTGAVATIQNGTEIIMNTNFHFVVRYLLLLCLLHNLYLYFKAYFTASEGLL